MHARTLALLLSAGAWFAAGIGSATAQPTGTAASTGDAARGKADFIAYGCYECHGTLGQGNYMSAPRIAPHPIPAVAIKAYIRRPAGEMPSYAASILPDKDVDDIYAYLASIPAGKNAAAIPALAGVKTTGK